MALEGKMTSNVFREIFRVSFLTCQVHRHPETEESNGHMPHRSALQQEPVRSVEANKLHGAFWAPEMKI